MKISQAVPADYTAAPPASSRGYKVVADAPPSMGADARWPGWARMAILLGGAAGVWVAVISIAMWALKAH